MALAFVMVAEVAIESLPYVDVDRGQRLPGYSETKLHGQGKEFEIAFEIVDPSAGAVIAERRHVIPYVSNPQAQVGKLGVPTPVIRTFDDMVVLFLPG